MDMQMLNELNEALVTEMLWTLGVLLRVFSVLAVGGLVVYLGGVVWLCYDELRQTTARVRPAPANRWCVAWQRRLAGCAAAASRLMRGRPTAWKSTTQGEL